MTVDTLTGALADQKLEFRLVGPIELPWLRLYDSSRNRRSFALGWGHTHEWDRRLWLDREHVVYEAPLGEPLAFPLPPIDGATVAMHGHTLERVSPQRYLVHRHGELSMAFEFADPTKPARLGLLFTGQHRIHFFYDAQGSFVGIADSAGRRIAADEDSDGRLRSLTLLAGDDRQADELLVAYEYDVRGNLQSARNAAGHGYEFEYDADNRLTCRTGRKGFRFRHRYDAEGRCVLSMGEGRMYGIALDYAVPGRLTKVTRPDGGIWRYTFDSAGRLAQIEDALGGVRSFVRDEGGRVAFELDANRAMTYVEYDATGVPVARITPRGLRVRLPEDLNAPDPNEPRVPDRPSEFELGALLDGPPARLPTVNDLKRAGLPAMIANLATSASVDNGPLAPAVTPFAVEPLGALWWPEPQQGRVFNHLGKLVAQHDDFGRLRRWFYDASGNLAEYVDFDGARWTNDTGPWHLPLVRGNPLGGQQRWSYTTAGEVANFTDAGGTTSEFRYDLNDRLIEVRRQGVLRDVYRRDLAGNLLSKHAADGRELLRLQIGPRNLPLVRTLASGDEHRFTYDECGRYLSADTRRDQLRIAYDEHGHRVVELRNGFGIMSDYGGGRHLLRSTILGRFTVRYHRRPGSLFIVDPTGATQRLRLPGHGLVERRFSNGTQETAQFDALGRCHFKAVLGRNGRLWSRRFHWSGEGELRHVQDNVGGDVEHVYDAAHRLRQRLCNDTGTGAFAFDAADNLLAQPGLADVTLDGNRLRTANGEHFVYNDRQHIEARRGPSGETRYHYDSRELLIEIDTPTGHWQAEYDALGRRCRKRWNGQTTEYHWHGEQLIGEVSPDGSLRLYVYVDPLAMTPLMFIDYPSIATDPAEGLRRFVLADQIGAPCLVEDDHGAMLWRARMQPFGSTQVTGELNFDFRFPGHYLDRETGLHYNRHRYYDPVLGRYLQSDPWGIAGGANVYAYRTNPLLRVDVRGLGEEGDPKCKKPSPDEEGTKEPTPKRKAGDDPDLMPRDQAEALARKKNEEYRQSLDEKIKNKEMSQRDAGPVAATVVDRRTGEAFFGHNDRNGNPPDNLHPLVEAQVNEARANPQHPSDPGSHAEVYALNDAVNAREAQRKEQGLPPMTKSDLDEFTQVSEWRKGSGDGRMKPGDDAPRCGNCQTCTDGVDNRSGDAPKWPPPYD